MMKKQGIEKIGILSIVILLFVGSSLYAQRGLNTSNQDNGLRQNQICQMIPDLTEDQQNKIEALRLVHMKEMNTFRNQKNELRAKKQTLMTSDNVDMKEINSVIDQMTGLHNKMMKLKAKHNQDIRSQLTDKQKVYFDSKPMHRHGHDRTDEQAAGFGRGNGQGEGYGKGHGANPNCSYNKVKD